MNGIFAETVRHQSGYGNDTHKINSFLEGPPALNGISGRSEKKNQRVEPHLFCIYIADAHKRRSRVEPAAAAV